MSPHETQSTGSRARHGSVLSPIQGGLAVWELAGTLVFFFGIVAGCAIAVALAAVGTAPAILAVLWLPSSPAPRELAPPFAPVQRLPVPPPQTQGHQPTRKPHQ